MLHALLSTTLPTLLASQSKEEFSNKELPIWGEGASLWMPPQASTVAPGVDWVFDLIYWVSMFFFVLIVALMVAYCWMYRAKKPGDGAVSRVTHNNTLEWTWTIIPTIIVLFMFYYGFTGYLDMATPPKDAIPIQVKAQKWGWQFIYPDGTITPDEIHLAKDQPYVLTMSSSDVTHSLYFPHFRVKKDVVPGRFSKMWFQPTEAGTSRLFCTEYCGSGHSDMIGAVYVYDSVDAWRAKLAELNDPSDLPIHKQGEFYVSRNLCLSCHSLDGTVLQGPSWAYMDGSGKRRSIWGQTHNFTDGTSAVVDEEYIKESIWYPNRKIVRGYAAQMNSYKGQIDESQILAIIEYIKSLDEDYVVPMPAGDDAAGDEAGVDDADGEEEAAPSEDAESADTSVAEVNPTAPSESAARSSLSTPPMAGA